MRKDLGEVHIHKKSFEIDMDINRQRKYDVKKAIQELKKDKIISWRGYKPNFKGIQYEYGKVISEKMKKYQNDFFLGQDEEKKRILKGVIVADYERKDYVLNYDWELVQYLTRNPGEKC